RRSSDLRMASVAADAGVFVGFIAEIDGVEAVAVGFVGFEADERKRADIDRAQLAIGHAEARFGVEGMGLAAELEFEAVAVVLAGDVAGEGVAAVGPPESRAFVRIEGKDLAFEALP